MRSRSFVVVAVLLVVLLVGAVGVYAYDHARRETIAKGVTVAGVDIGGLSTTQARRKLRRTLRHRLARPVTVTWQGRRFVLTPAQARVRAHVAGSVAEALARSRDGNVITRTARGLTGGAVDVDLRPRITYSHAAVDGLVKQVAGAVDQPVQEAGVSFSGGGVSIAPGHDGRRVQVDRLRAAVLTALGSRRASHTIPVHVARTHPTRNPADVARRYPVLLTLDRAAFRLSLYKDLKLVKSYTVAVGQQGLETPAGLYHIQDKAVNPSWHVPNSPWAGSMAGQVIPPGPDDPIKARWMGIFDGAGIHGTDETYSLGHAFSHGCVRMSIPDVIELYPQVPVGTPIYIA